MIAEVKCHNNMINDIESIVNNYIQRGRQTGKTTDIMNNIIKYIIKTTGKYFSVPLNVRQDNNSDFKILFIINNLSSINALKNILIEKLSNLNYIDIKDSTDKIIKINIKDELCFNIIFDGYAHINLNHKVGYLKDNTKIFLDNAVENNIIIKHIENAKKEYDKLLKNK